MPPTYALVLETVPQTLISLSTVDLLVIVLYFCMVLGIGLYLKRFTKTGEDFFLAGREMTQWVAGLSFVAANLGSLELMGWAAAAYQYGILATHWYWIGAIPAMLFLGIVMMPFYYISKTHSVPGLSQAPIRGVAPALRGRQFWFDDSLHERHQYVLHGSGDESHPGLGHSFQHLGFVADGGGVCVSRRSAFGHLQRSSAVLSHLARRHPDFSDRLDRNRRMERHGAPHCRQFSRPGLHPSVEHARLLPRQSHGNSLDRHRTRARLGDFVRLLDNGLPGCAKGARRKGSSIRQDGSNHRRIFKMCVPFIVILPGLLASAVLPMKLVGESQAGRAFTPTTKCCR